MRRAAATAVQAAVRGWLARRAVAGRSADWGWRDVRVRPLPPAFAALVLWARCELLEGLCLHCGASGAAHIAHVPN
eukprot:4313458-Alexandrium_andersonii.AAC.1